MWICPSCQLPLIYDQNVWKCASHHHFDQAKEGYVNLQLAQDRKSKSPGDNKEMIDARRLFLQSSYYDPLIQKLIELINQLQSNDLLTLLDAGCGEGYYLAQIRAGLSALGKQTHALGCDISKIGIQRAAKRYKDCKFSVASTFKIPLPSASVDVVTQVFAPASEQEVARVLSANGVWIRVNPAANHLTELKQAIYRDGQSHNQESVDSPYFVCDKSCSVSFQFSLDNPQHRAALLKMTPFYWHTSEEAKAAFIEASYDLTADFDIQVLRKADDQ